MPGTKWYDLDGVRASSIFRRYGKRTWMAMLAGAILVLLLQLLLLSSLIEVWSFCFGLLHLALIRYPRPAIQGLETSEGGISLIGYSELLISKRVASKYTLFPHQDIVSNLDTKAALVEVHDRSPSGLSRNIWIPTATKLNLSNPHLSSVYVCLKWFTNDGFARVSR